jgi:hypothetical protein
MKITSTQIDHLGLAVAVDSLLSLAVPKCTILAV